MSRLWQCVAPMACSMFSCKHHRHSGKVATWIHAAPGESLLFHFYAFIHNFRHAESPFLLICARKGVGISHFSFCIEMWLRTIFSLIPRVTFAFYCFSFFFLKRCFISCTKSHIFIIIAAFPNSAHLHGMCAAKGFVFALTGGMAILKTLPRLCCQVQDRSHVSF